MSIFSNKSDIIDSVDKFSGWGAEKNMELKHNRIEYHWEPSNEPGTLLLSDLGVIRVWDGESDIRLAGVDINMTFLGYSQNYHGSFTQNKTRLYTEILLHYITKNSDRSRACLVSYYEEFNVENDYTMDDLKNAINHLLVYMKDNWKGSVDNIYNSDTRTDDLLKDALIYEHIQ